jgi:DNA modification methylase
VSVTKTNTRPLCLEYVPIAQLRADPRNARKHSPAQIEAIARSIDGFGFNVPLLIDARGTVVAGHARLEAAKRFGIDLLPAIRLEHLSHEQALAFRIADNRLAEHASWDEALLGEVFRDLSIADLDLTLTGFSVPEIDLLIEGLPAGSEGDPDPADRIVPEGPPVSRLGDIWRLGPHRLACANAVEGRSFEALLQGRRAHLVFTDPPFNVPIRGHVAGKGRRQYREFAMASGEMTSAEFQAFLQASFRELARFTVSGALIYVFMDWRHVPELVAASANTSLHPVNLCIWVKNNGGLGSFYRSQHELIFVYRNGRVSHRNNVQLGRYGRNRTNVWQYPSVINFGRRVDQGDGVPPHPTAKPVALIADAILDCTARGDLVLDPFIGSGSTLIAAERVGRVCYGIDMDPLYVDATIRRWQQYTGETAVHADVERSFNEMAADRHG